MSSPARLNLQLEEPGDDLLSDQAFDILRDTLQPDSESPLETAVQKIVALLPEGKPYSREVGVFLETCYEMADQIPYSHPSMTKLTNLVYLTLWQAQDKTGEKVQSTPYQKLVETIRDWWNSMLESHSKSHAAKMLTPKQAAAQLRTQKSLSISRPSQLTSMSMAL
jgi:hypothetical protein